MMNFNGSGMTMLLKAMGFDPEMLALKAAELEQLGKQAAVQLQAGVNDINIRLANIETGITSLHHKIDMALSSTAPAGESTPYLLEAPIQPKEEKQHHGRTTAVNRTNRSARKAS